MRQTLLVQNVFSYYRMCSLTTECVLLLQNVFCPNRTQLTRIVEHAADPGKGSDQVKQEGSGFSLGSSKAGGFKV